MKKISSHETLFMKYLFPALWVCMIAFMVIRSIYVDELRQNFIFLVMPWVIAIVGYVFMKKLVWPLLDEVYDGGDFLLVKNRGVEERIPLDNILNVRASAMMNPPRVSLKLVKASKFGNEISFMPAKQFTLNPFAKNRVAENLITRVDAVQRNQQLQ